MVQSGYRNSTRPADLQKLLAKVKVIPPLVDEADQAALKLRTYFTMLGKRRKGQGRSLPIPPKYTLYLEPCPFLFVYRPEDDKTVLKNIKFTSFRTAYRQYMNALKAFKKEASRKNKASMIL